MSLYYAAPGLGIVASGLPFVLQAFGPGSWWIAWWVLTLLAAVMTVPLLLARFESKAAPTQAGAAYFSIVPVLVYLAGYFFVRRGLHRRHDFHDRLRPRCRWWSRGAGRLLEPDRLERLRDTVGLARCARARPRGLATAIILAINAFGASLPSFGHSLALLATSALVFGVAFFAVVGSTTALVRFNYPPAAWPTAIATMTIAFGVGQTLGPILVGAINDALGSVAHALNVSAALLALGAALAALQRKLARVNCR